MAIEYSECAVAKQITARLKGLPKGFSYVIHHDLEVQDVRPVRSISSSGANGSVRHYTFRTYEEAMAHGIAWAKRRMAKLAA